jgi:hypothetical protein
MAHAPTAISLQDALQQTLVPIAQQHHYKRAACASVRSVSVAMCGTLYSKRTPAMGFATPQVRSGSTVRAAP